MRQLIINFLWGIVLLLCAVTAYLFAMLNLIMFLLIRTSAMIVEVFEKIQKGISFIINFATKRGLAIAKRMNIEL